MTHFMQRGPMATLDADTGTGTGGGEAAAAAAADAAAAAAAAAAAGGDKPWHDGLDAEHVGFIQSKGWHDKTPAEAAREAVKSYREAQRFIGADPSKIIKLPTDAADEAGWKEVRTKLGVPLDAKDYDLTGLKFSDGTEPGADFVDWFKATAHKNGVPKEAAQALAAEFVQYVEKADSGENAERTVKLAEEHKTLDASWGQNKDINLFLAKKGAEALKFTPEHVTALEGVVGYAKIMEALRSVGELTGEAKFIGGGQGPNGAGGLMTREQAANRKSELMKDGVWVKKYMDGDTASVREMTALNTIIVGDDTDESRRA